MPDRKPTLDYQGPHAPQYPWWGVPAAILFAVLTVGLVVAMLVSIALGW